MAEFKYSNSNPKNDCNDCAVRSIATAANLPWEQVMRGLCDVAIAKYLMPNDLEVVSEYLSGLVGPDKGLNFLPNTITLDEFCQKFPKGRYAVQCMNHGVAVIDGVIYDTYNSSNDQVATAWLVG